LSYRIAFFLGHIGAGIVHVSSREVDELWGSGYFLTRASFLNEVDDIFLDFAVLQ
jgi:hypothetical protein